MESPQYGPNITTTISRLSTKIYLSEINAIQTNPRCKLKASDMAPSEIKRFTFPLMIRTYAEIAPRLWDLICILSSVSHADVTDFMKRDANNDSDDENEPDYNAPRDARSKVLPAGTAIAMIAFARSRVVNWMQATMGYYLYSTRTGKRTIAVLNRMGISTSYTTIINALTMNAQRVRESLMHRVLNQPVLLTYDNMTNYNKVTNETLFNKSVQYCFTAGATVFLRMPISLAARSASTLLFWTTAGT